MKIKLLHPRATIEHLGLIPGWLNEANPKHAREQLNDGYVFGGWQSFGEGKIKLNPDNSFSYPGDPPQMPFAEIEFRDERIYMYPGSWVLVKQPDGSFEICRMD